MLNRKAFQQSAVIIVLLLFFSLSSGMIDFIVNVISYSKATLQEKSNRYVHRPDFTLSFMLASVVFFYSFIAYKLIRYFFKLKGLFYCITSLIAAIVTCYVFSTFTPGGNRTIVTVVLLCLKFAGIYGIYFFVPVLENWLYKKIMK